MTPLTLVRPEPRGLVAPGLDPRPCVTNPPQMWDLGNDGNRQAMALCQTCPAMDDDTCEITPGTIRRGIPWSDHLNEVKLCHRCGHPRIRQSNRGPITCKCPESSRTREQVIKAWLAAGGDTRPIADIAPELGMEYHALRDTLRRARKAGDRRVPLLKQEAA
ncbi:hypothetical protein [Micromonospora sp. NPDC005299]|uniref:hypothetical protein n=1 Tax=Micromonospora sp. NPDC005299 TaxID=3364231 RepID=UPI00368A3FE6